MYLRLAFIINISLFAVSFFKCSYCISQFHKRNIIIFFTKPDIDEDATPIDDTGIQFLKFPVSGMVQSNDDIPEEFENIFKINLNSPDCNAIFSTYLLDLINWAIEDKGMVTATISSKETEFNRVILNNIGSSFQGSYKNFKFTLHLPRKIQRNAIWANSEPMDPYRSRASYQNEFYNLPLATIDPSLRGLPPLRFENHGDFIRDITAYNLNDNDNDVFGFKRVRSKIEAENKNKNKKYEISSSTSTAITTKRTSRGKPKGIDKKTTISNTATTISTTGTTVKANKNANNFLAAISFFNKLQDIFMDSLLNPYAEKRNSEENQIDYSAIGKVNENTMLKVVKSTLKSLKMQTRDQDLEINGFLMIVIGGNISEISDPFSELIQSVKYVTEHTNKQDSLILVTCYCPIRSIENRIEKRRIPYFAGGMDSDDFKNTISMWDMLDKMKCSVKNTWKKGKSKVNQLIHPHKSTDNKDVNGTSCKDINITLSTPKNTEAETTDTNSKFERKRRASESSNALTYVNFGVIIKYTLLFDFLVYYFMNG